MTQGYQIVICQSDNRTHSVTHFLNYLKRGDKESKVSDGTTSGEDPSQLGQLNDHLRKLAAMDKIGIRRKIVLLEGYIHKLKNNIK